MDTANGASISAGDKVKCVGTTYVLVDHDSQTILARTKSLVFCNTPQEERQALHARAKSKLVLWGEAQMESAGADLYCEVFTADYATSSNLGYGLTTLDQIKAEYIF